MREPSKAEIEAAAHAIALVQNSRKKSPSPDEYISWSLNNFHEARAALRAAYAIQG